MPDIKGGSTRWYHLVLSRVLHRSCTIWRDIDKTKRQFALRKWVSPPSSLLTDFQDWSSLTLMTKMSSVVWPRRLTLAGELEKLGDLYLESDQSIQPLNDLKSVVTCQLLPSTPHFNSAHRTHHAPVHPETWQLLLRVPDLWSRGQVETNQFHRRFDQTRCVKFFLPWPRVPSVERSVHGKLFNEILGQGKKCAINLECPWHHGSHFSRKNSFKDKVQV